MKHFAGLRLISAKLVATQLSLFDRMPFYLKGLNPWVCCCLMVKQSRLWVNEVGKKMKLSNILVLLTSLMLFVADVRAFEISLSEQQINSMLRLSFPVQQNYQGFALTFSDPEVTLDGANHSVQLKSVIVAQQNGQKMRATASVKGRINYNPAERVIEIIKPELLAFAVADNSIKYSEQVIGALRQAVGQQLPLVFLLDVSQLNQLLPGVQPKDISIRGRYLIIGF